MNKKNPCWHISTEKIVQISQRISYKKASKTCQ
jgi:hypothetical protein